RSLNPGPLSILFPLLDGAFALPRRLQGQVVIVAAHGHRPPRPARTVETTTTGLAVFARELDLDDLIGAFIDRRSPALPCTDRWAGRSLAVPVELKAVGSKSLPCLRLPPVVRPRGSQEIDAVVTPASDQQLRIEIASINEMNVR